MLVTSIFSIYHIVFYNILKQKSNIEALLNLPSAVAFNLDNVKFLWFGKGEMTVIRDRNEEWGTLHIENKGPVVMVELFTKQHNSRLVQIESICNQQGNLLKN